MMREREREEKTHPDVIRAAWTMVQLECFVVAYLLYVCWTENIRAVTMSVHAKHWHSSEISSKIHVLLYLHDDERFLQNLYVRWTNGTHAMVMH